MNTSARKPRRRTTRFEYVQRIQMLAALQAVNEPRAEDWAKGLDARYAQLGGTSQNPSGGDLEENSDVEPGPEER
ncbi:hypothetical protein [Variovorax sp. KK3]|uniref:hypothetical protein n=1 Tax=Variovorax sp. KK3 TaxID=1855728 RepID=UPI0011812233|nr:hypothetical protein [Variovorax sp. KK3]